MLPGMATPMLIGGKAGGDPYAANVTLLMHFDGANNSTAFTDLKGHTFSRSGNPVISTAQSKFGGASYSSNGDASGYISTPDSPDLQFGSGDFTIEWWWYWGSSTSYPTFWNKGYVGSTALLIQGLAANKAFGVYFSAASNQIAESPAATSGQWYYYALVRSGSTLTLYRDGTSVGSASVSGLSNNSSASLLLMGSSSGGDSAVNCFCDEVRVTKGIARTVTSIPSSPFSLT